jgi:APA family basic amino acid/polyamine antiporter
METHKDEKHTGFRVPYINGRLLVPILCLIFLFLFIVFDTDHVFQNISLSENWTIIAFWILFVALSILSFRKRYSAIPVLGMISNFYLMTQLNFTNWAAFIIWLLFGLVIYFMYGKKHSRLQSQQAS